LGEFDYTTTHKRKNRLLRGQVPILTNTIGSLVSMILRRPVFLGISAVAAAVERYRPASAGPKEVKRNAEVPMVA
jgi:hypothetical protein